MDVLAVELKAPIPALYETHFHIHDAERQAIIARLNHADYAPHL